MTAFTGVVLTTAAITPAATTDPQPWRPVVMVAVGDSISAGFNACGWYVRCVTRSWSAGDDPSVQSHYMRLLDADEAVYRNNVNLAVPGATSAGLAAQLEKAVSHRADYVTLLIGAQDACASDERRMTPVAVYQKRVSDALRLLRAGRPDARVFVASIPDIKRLWQVGKDSVVARGFWAFGRICPTMLSRPTATSAADRARRDRVRARVVGYNAALARVCAAYGPACRFDGNALFNQRFTLNHVSRWDYFHPSAAGQRLIAQRTFDAVRDWITGDDRQPALAS
ncbi:lysophospholipase L1-like esterase [Streptosporangium becharense]|uniref:Lysophospholipase L1-like esterase n=1 Tax=Streptosporangium becharense TaxID=1816182 RepID=A0A7W9IBF5_9ACTN|nr:GDSL-type esterase/lipase family protein [Streptosporangium becharense]MBB2915421.1 lysophospholipase L1-like esterase [Streptosporangium becharense]MBB5817608.1 lysophospholipase L1-like esterase [Streptosporangium becharense]